MKHKNDITGETVEPQSEVEDLSGKTVLDEESKHAGTHHRKGEHKVSQEAGSADDHTQGHGHGKGQSHKEDHTHKDGHGHKEGHGNCKRLAVELAEEKKLSDEYLDLARRTKAEFENFRRRTDTERSKIGEIATANVIQKLLGPLDDLDRAIEASSVSGDSQDLLKGVEMIRDHLKKAFQEMGLEEISPENEPFDPNLHEAVMAIESDEHEDDQVREVFQKGYRLKDRIIRPAKVQVTKKK